MADNRKQWNAWREVEKTRTRRKSAVKLHNEGIAFYEQSDFRRAIDRFHEAAELAEEQGDVDGQCRELQWEGHCWRWLGKLKTALERLLRAESLGGGDAGNRFWIWDELFLVANLLPLPLAKQEELLKKLAPYKGFGQIGGSKSTVLNREMMLLQDRGDWRGALDRAQEAFACQVDKYPSLYESVYYRDLIFCYRKNGLLLEARKTLQDWRAHGSTEHTMTKSLQFRAEAQILYADGRLGAEWDAIRRCQVEERYLKTHGTTKETETLTWLIRIAADSGCLREAREALPTLFRFHNAESLYRQYDCFYWFAYYYAALWRHLRGGGVSASRYETPEIARKRAEQWYARAERVGRELDSLLETDVKRKELDALREKL